VPAEPAKLGITLAGGRSVSALLDAPSNPRACYVFAHGAGAAMDHAFMTALARGLAERGIAVLRFNFPFMEARSRRPDSPAVAQAAVRAATAEAARRFPQLPLFAGGKSFGGRMTTQAQAAEPLAGVQGVVLVGFPLHAAGKPSTQRAAHLAQVALPMLFLQGTRDALADLTLIHETSAALGERATLHVVEGADHSFHVLVRSGRTDAEVITELCDTAAGWMLARPAMG
jgi:predicted alpha/beta-hydrolase family hydrolase